MRFVPNNFRGSYVCSLSRNCCWLNPPFFINIATIFLRQAVSPEVLGILAEAGAGDMAMNGSRRFWSILALPFGNQTSFAGKSPNITQYIDR